MEMAELAWLRPNNRGLLAGRVAGRLLRDVESGMIDVVVVYKIDRLSRSLTDFAKLVDVFERHNVTFVSVTQQFNTTTSMGRLTLNILLSFAQFEREVIGERIRDKFAAPAVYRWMRHRLVLSGGVRGGEHDGHDDTGRWPGGARPARWRRRASASAAPADVGRA